MREPVFRRLFFGFIYLHILHHAAEGEVYGASMMEELAQHGYDVSPGTMYPVLHWLEAQGWLQRQDRLVGGRIRKYYTITSAGQQVLEEGRKRAWELTSEIVEGEPKP
ncbi:MAG: PadR family transcriptional regulator [Bacillota bacterium]